MPERALLVTSEFLSVKRSSDVKDASTELEELCRSAGLSVTQSLIVRQKSPQAPLLLGRGKVQELKELVQKESVDVLVFNSDLSSSQQRNLEEIVQTKTIDRTQLILDIFATRARSSEGKVQVELAQLKYLLPRLTGKGIYLSRLGGGVGTRGPGEQKLEVDRRRIRERITRLARSLEDLRKRRVVDIERKKEKNMPLVTLVGYTNAGKSTLFNALTHASVIVQDKLFSTLDTTTRLLSLPQNQKAMLVDTVGFVRDLPHHLIESFKATLEGAVHADILLHVIDASRADVAILRKAVDGVLAELGTQAKETLLIFNKIDLLNKAEREGLLRNESAPSAIFLSAQTGEGLEALLKNLSAHLDRSRLRKELFVPSRHFGLLDYLYKEGEVLERKDGPSGAHFLVNLTPETEAYLKKKLGS